jgi:hypothetical protein
MRKAKENYVGISKELKQKYKKEINELKQKYKCEKDYADKRDSGLLERHIFSSDHQISLYKMDFDYFNSSLDGNTYAVYIEQDKHKRESQYQHMCNMEFSNYPDAKIVYNSLVTSNSIMLFSPVTENQFVGKEVEIIVKEG